MADFEDKFINMDAVQVAETIGQPYKRSGNYVMTACYNAAGHKNGDRKPSMAIYGLQRGFYCYSCGVSGTNSWLLKEFGVRPDNYNPVIIDRPVAAPEPENPLLTSDVYKVRLKALYDSLPELPEQAIEMMEAKGLFHDMFADVETLGAEMQWKWHTNQVRGWGEGIFIPYVEDGEIITARLRIVNPKPDQPRFLSMPGNTMHPYNLDVVMKHDAVFVTEGETDCLTANMMELPAVAIPGATSGKAIARLIAKAQEYNTRLIIIPDNDEAGEKFARRMLLEGYAAKVAVDVIAIPFTKDLNDWYNKASGEQLSEFVAKNRCVGCPKNPALTNRDAVAATLDYKQSALMSEDDLLAMAPEVHKVFFN